MDLLRFLVLLPLRLLRGLLAAVVWLSQPLLGRFSWTAPGWLTAGRVAVRRQPRRAAALAMLTVLLLLGGYGGWRWYRAHPGPAPRDRITFQVQPPSITDYTAPTPVFDPLVVRFSGSVAPIEAVGKPVTAGIVMEPALPGEWRWTDDRTLRFQPTTDWPVGTRYSVRLDAARAFAPHVKVDGDQLAFTTRGFAAAVAHREFYQDPQQPTAKQAIVQVHFNYPVDPASFEQRIRLTLQDRDRHDVSPLKYTVTYDAPRLNAWVHSQPLKLPRDPGAVALAVDDGVRSGRGGDGTDDKLAARVRVPGLYSLAVDEVSATLVDNDKYEPEQVLVVALSGTVRDSDLAASTRAWVLPRRKPGVPQPSGAPPYPWSTGEVSEAVLARSHPLALDAVPAANDYQALQSFRFQAEPGQRVYVRVTPGLTSFGGYVLGKPQTRVVTVPDYPKLLRFMADGSLLSASGSRRLSVVSRNLPGMRVEIGRVLPGQLQHLASLNQGSFSHPQLGYGLGEDDLVERYVIKQGFPPPPADDPGKARYDGVDLSPYLKDGRRGVFLLHLSSYDPALAARQAQAKVRARRMAEQGVAPPAPGESADAGPVVDDDGRSASGYPHDDRLIVVTDLGMLVKQAVDGSHDVFVQSIRQGTPVDAATVSVVAVNGETLFSQSTHADGVVHFPSFKGLEREKKPVMYLVTRGDDLSFLPIDGSDRRLDYSRFDVGGEPSAVNHGQLSAYLFSDRGIYRPGDTFHIGLIVRAASWTRSVAGMPLQAEIVDPRGVTVRTVPIAMDATGFAELSYAPDETAPTGTWAVNLQIVRNGHGSEQIGNTTVQVKEFLPDRMKVMATLSQQVVEGWIKPDQLKALVDVQNLFGTPAAKRRVEGTLTLRPAWPGFRSWPDYHFYDVRRAREGYQEALQDTVTDDSGHAQFALDLTKYADATYQLYFLGKAYEAGGGRSVAAAAQTLVSGNDWLVGYKAVDDLDYVSRGAQRTVRLVAIDPHARSIRLEGLKAQLVERRYVSVLTRQDSGVYKYQSTLKEIPLRERPLAIDANGIDYALPTDKPGNFALVIRRADRTEVNRIDYSVAGAGNVSRSLERNSELQLHLDKADYQPGQTIAVAIRAPYTGSGLITIERDKVYAHAWFHTDTTSSVQHITVPPGFEGNGYVNVQFVRDPSSDEIFMSPLSYGVVPFSVALDARREALTLDAPALVKPGHRALFKLHADRPTRAVVFAVDEGILQVARYKLGDPLQFFFRKRMLEVTTSQILDLILPDFEQLMAMAAPGGDADAAIDRQLNPFKRKRDKPVAFWSGIVDVDGERTLSYAVPDYFNGKLRVMAVAVSPQRIGTVEASTTVRGDFVLSPNVPTTLAPGDEVQVSVGVANNLTGLEGRQVPVAVTLRTGPQLQAVGPSTRQLSLGEMREGMATFRLRATDRLGSAHLAFTASYGGKSASRGVDLSVRPASVRRTTVDIGRVDAGGKQDVTRLRPMYDAHARRSAAFSSLPLVLAQGLSAYLVDFQHDCTEQLISRAIPALVLGQRPEFDQVLHASPSGDHAGSSQGDTLAAVYALLHTRQNAQGGFGLWTATPDAEPFLSDYAMHFMLEARERGLPVPRDMFDAGNAYLRRVAGDSGQDSLASLRQRAYAIYLLTRQGTVTTNDLASVQKRLQEAYPKRWQDDLAAAWLAASYRLLKQDREADRLMAGPLKRLSRSERDEDWHFADYDDPLVHDATVLYLLARHFPQRLKALPPAALDHLVWPLQHGYFNTLSSAMTVLALDAYADPSAGPAEPLAIGAVQSDGRVQPIGTVQGMLKLATWASGAQRLRLSNHGSQPAWYVVSQGGYDRDTPQAPVRNGFEIVRDYTDVDGKPLDRMALGQEIDVHLKIRATGTERVDHLAIVDLLPGGFEPVIQPPAPVTDRQDGDATEPGGDSEVAASAWRSPIGLDSSSWHPEYADIREDRVVIYGQATPGVREFVYRIKATNAGTFVVPPAFGESLYDRTVQARSAGGGHLTVVSQTP